MTSTVELLRLDAAGRRAAQTRFAGTLVLEAGAGTGKTTTLVARILAWSLDAGWRRAASELGDEAGDERVAAATLRGVVAITFTEAGAAEMAGRVAAGLARLTGGGDGLTGFDAELMSAEAASALPHRAQHLLAALDHLTVETIHAYCRRLLATHPLEAGLHPELQVDPDLRLSEEIVHEVVDEAARRAYARPRGEPLAELAMRGIGPDRIVRSLVGLREAGLEARALQSDPWSAEGLGGIVARLGRLVDAFLEAGAADLRRVTTGSKAAAVATALERTRERLGAPPADLSALELWIAGLDGLWSDHLGKLGDWSRSHYSKGEAMVLGAHDPAFAVAAGALRGPLRQLGRLQPRLLDTARRALAPLLAESERRCAARGIVTFADLLARAHDLLQRQPALRRREQRRIQQLLVDEFQDTDPLQCEIVRLLALAGAPRERPGLFLVGDPKQSIFGWRDADLAAYQGFVDRALAEDGAQFPLARNFRSDPPILAEVGAVVAPVMRPEPGFQPEFVGLVAHFEGSRLDAPRWAPVEYWVSWQDGALGGPRTTVDAAAELEAEAIAGDVRALHDEAGVRWSEVALLFRSTSRMDTYLEALRRHDVPFLVTRDKHYYRRKEIIDAAALVRAIVDPLDHLALVTYLRSACVGVPDCAFIPLWRGDFPRLATAIAGPASPALDEVLDLVDRIEDALPGDVPGLDRIAGWRHNLAAAMEDLAALRASFRNDPAADFVALLRQRTLLEVTEAARYQGKFRLANLDRFFRRLEAAMVERGNDMLAILRTLRRSLDEAPDAKEAPPKDSGDDAIQVLTIHKAKGLEFDHVYVPQMHAQSRREQDPGDYEVDRRWRVAAAPQYCLLGAATPSWDEVSERARRIEETESVRLLYVALTRARHRVVLIGSWPDRVIPRSAAESRSLLDLVHSRPGLPAAVGDLAARCAAADRSWVDDEGIRWRFLGAAENAAETGARRIEPAWLPSAASVLAQAGELAARAAQSAARMARPRQRPASATAAFEPTRLAEVESSADGATRGSWTRDAARLLGTAVHRIFEEWNLRADPATELAAARDRLAACLTAWLPPEDLDPVLARGTAVLDRFAGGELWRRWLTVVPHVVARELPLLLPAPVDDLALDCVSGAIDLLFRDPADGAWVIADYKTDQIETEADLAARAAVYAPQERVYATALRQALDLPEPPRTELWFLWADRLWRTP